MRTRDVQRYEHVGSAFTENPAARVILMTATLSPPQTAVMRSDPSIRIRDYCEAMSFYLTLPSEQFDRIILADNSCSDLMPLLEIVKLENHSKRVELLSFQANDHNPSFGKAYGEFRLLDKALEVSSCIRPNDHVWKTTGRLQCLNISNLDMTISLDYCFACDLYNLPFIRTGRWNNQGQMDLRLFRFKPDAYDRWLRGIYRDNSDSFNEITLYNAMVSASESIPVCPRFPIQPIISGISGRTQRNYLSTTQRFKNNIRSVTRRIAPWLWL